MYVGISIRDEATRTLSRIDTTMNSLESHFRRFGSSINSSFHGMNGLNSRIDASAGNMRTLQRYTSQLEREMSEARSEMQRMTQRISDAEAETESLRNEMQRVNNQVNNANKSMGIFGFTAGKVKNTIIGIGTAIGAVKVIEKSISMVNSAVDGAIKRVDTLSGFPVVMDKMGYSSELAKTSINKLSEGIQGLPTTLDGIVASTQSITLMTGDLDKATDTALALNNAFIASGSGTADAERGLVQYVQMLSKGKVDMVSWQTLQETMGFALNKTAEAFGYTGKSAQRDLYTALQKGKVSFNDFNNKLIKLNNGVGGFAEIAKDSSAGISTAMGNMNTAVVRGVAGVIQSVQEVLAGTSLKSIENVFGLIGNGFSKTLGLVAEKIKGIDAKKLGDNLTQGLETVKSVAIPTFEAVKTGLGWMIDNKDMVISATAGIAGGFAALKVITFVKTALDLYKASTFASTFATHGFNAALRANPIGLVVTGIGLLIAAGVYLYQNWDTVRAKTGALWDKLGAFKGVATLVLGPIGQIIRTAVTMAENWDNTKSVWENVWNGIKISAANAVNDVIGSVNWLIEKINSIPGVNFPIIPKVEWGNVNNGQGQKAINKVSAGGFAPEHATGLERVPYDGYFAKLHKDESVLTAQQSNALRSAGMLSQNSDGTPELNIGGGGTTQQGSNVGGGGHQFVFNITGDNPVDIAQKVREIISDVLGEELQIM